MQPIATDKVTFSQCLCLAGKMRDRLNLQTCATSHVQMASMRPTLTILFILALGAGLQAQTLPPTMTTYPELHRMITDGQAAEGVYDEALIREVHLAFEQPDYWQQLIANKDSGFDIVATMSADGLVFPGVGVRFKGQTSYSQIQQSKKKSFNITLDFSDPQQNWAGYETLNFNNAF
jgi:hypothetical protein